MDIGDPVSVIIKINRRDERFSGIIKNKHAKMYLVEYNTYSTTVGSEAKTHGWFSGDQIEPREEG